MLRCIFIEVLQTTAGTTNSSSLNDFLQKKKKEDCTIKTLMDKTGVSSEDNFIRHDLKSRHQKEVEKDGAYLTPDHITILVCDPLSHEDHTGAKYTTFKVQTNTTFREYRQNDFSVRRRYSEFVWLRSVLQKKLEGQPPSRKYSSLPPLPPKLASVSGLWKKEERFDPAFIEERRVGLEKFINSIANHTYCRFQKELHAFLQDQDAVCK